MFVTDAPFSTAGLEAYRPFVGDATIDYLRSAAAPLRGARVLHVNGTATGGGVAELLLSLVPLMRDVGLEVDWYALDAGDHFFEVTKGYHNALQGRATPWSERSFDVYWEGCRSNARRLVDGWKAYDIVVVHDPQPLVLRSLLDRGNKWLWRCHIDMTAPGRDVWRMLSPHLAGYDMLVFSTPEYVPGDLEAERVDTALPCIDPFRTKNRPLREGDVGRVARRYGIDPDRPYLLQVSRFDPWKDPLGVVDVYRRVKRERPAIQLVYMATMAADDPEGARIYEETRRATADDPDVHLLALRVPQSRVSQNALEVNAMQRGARVVLQKSIREGFGLVVAEALWKQRPVVAGDVGGIRYQICDGWNGYRVRSVDDCASRVLDLLADPDRSAAFGARGREVVQSRFLFTRLLEQYLLWIGELAGVRRDVEASERRSLLAAIPGAELPAVVSAGSPLPPASGPPA